MGGEGHSSVLGGMLCMLFWFSISGEITVTSMKEFDVIRRFT